MMPDDPEPARETARALIEEGLREAAAIEHPVARARHRAAWAFRLSALDPEGAASLLDELPEEPALRSRLLATVASDLRRLGRDGLEPYFGRAVELGRGLEAESRLRLLNALSETAIDLAESDRIGAARLLRQLAPEVRDLAVPPGHLEQPRALGCTLVGEALLELDDPEGERLLEDGLRYAEELPGRDSILSFIAGALAGRDPEGALALVEMLEDPASRLETRLQLAEKLDDPALRDRLYGEAEADALQMEPMRRPEALVLVAQTAGARDPERARRCFQQALEGADAEEAQLRSLQRTGVAAALAAVDREWAGRVFEEAVAEARSEADRGRRTAALVLIAGEMAASHPREAAALFEEAIEDALGLEALWEYAHLLDLIFRQDRSAFLDVAPARRLVERVLESLSEDDPRVPGVFGVPEAARLMLQVDPEGATALLRRWFTASERAGDTDAMTQAAVALCGADEEAGLAALREAQQSLLRRVDCPAMGEFSRQAASLAPGLVLEVAEQIPDPRERADATALAAVHLYPRERERALTLLRSLERPVDRSAALLNLADSLLQTGDRPHPQPLLEEMP